MKLSALLNRIRSDETGGASVEFVVAVPLIMFWFAGSYTIFDAYASSSRALKATYAVADVLSRQTEIDDAYIDDMNALYANMIGQPTDSTAMRVTSIRKTDSWYDIDWSDATGGGTDMVPVYIPAGLLPTMITEETIIFVETFNSFSPLWSYAGINPRTVANRISVSPRFSPMLVNTDG